MINVFLWGILKRLMDTTFTTHREQSVARNGVFLEREFISKGTSGSKVQLEEVREPQDNIELHVDTHSQQNIVDTPPIA